MNFTLRGAATLASSLLLLTGASAQTQGVASTVPPTDDARDKAGAVPAVPAPAAELPMESTGAPEPAGPAVRSERSEFASGLTGTATVDGLLTAPMVARDGDALVVRGRGYKMTASPEEFVFSPVVGKRRDSSLGMGIREILVGGEALELAPAGAVADVDGRVEIDRGAVVEAYDYELDSVEQLFRFDSLPGAGDLVLTLDLDTDLAVTEGPAGLRFSNGIAAIDYSDAFVLDVDGGKTPIETTWTRETVTLTVPAAYLATAHFPVTIDPVLTNFGFSGGTQDDSEPDLAFDRDNDEYLAVFQDFVSVNDSDLYVFGVSTAGSVRPGSFSSVALGGTEHTKPAIAVNDAADQFLVVATAGATNSRIEGFLINVTPGVGSGYDAGAAFVVNDNPGGFPCSNADVAGNTFGTVNTFGYAVTWTREFSATDRDVHARIVDSAGNLTTGRISVDNSSQNDVQCSISSSIGGSDIGGNYYNVVWVRDDDFDDRGEIWTRRLYFDGTFGGPRPSSGTQVTTSDNGYGPVTTSASLEALELTGERYFVIAYAREFPSFPPAPVQSSVYASVSTFDNQVGPSLSVNQMEDIDTDENQLDVAIAGDGEGFLLVYGEAYQGNQNDFDQYMVSGGVQDGFNGDIRVALAERYQNLSFTGLDERGAAIASQYDGNERGTGNQDDACILWTAGGDPATSRLDGATVDLFNNDPLFGARAIGTQYCDANLNASGRKGWIRAMAMDQSLGTDKRLVAVDLTLNAFGYLLASRSQTFVPNPAGAAGNLCVAGAGRYVNAIANSGGSGTITTIVTPGSIPQPTGFVSGAAGERWFFQYWSRDVAGGQATANFTNAVSFVFTP